jgi:tetratricopeptide (TPR) repeat protein
LISSNVTARGIDIPLDHYLGLTLKHLSERSLKEVIGLVAFNSAAIFLKSKDWKSALCLYQKALRFENGYEVHQMVSLCELLLGHKVLSQEIASRQVDNLPLERLENDLLLLDLSKGALTSTGAETILLYNDVEGEEIPKAIAHMQDEITHSPESQTLPFHLAHLWLSYGKPKEAIPLLEKISIKQEATCTIHTLLAMLYQERLNFPKAWEEAKKAAVKAKQRSALPHQLKQLILSFHSQSPNCQDLVDMIG